MTKPRKMKGKEVALMVVPCLALASMGWSLRDRRGAILPTTPANTVTIDDIELEPATPLEVSRGYDSRVTVDYLLPRVPPSPAPNQRPIAIGISNPLNTRLTYRKNSVEHSLPVAIDVTSNLSTDKQQAVFLLRLSRVPLKLGELIFKTSFTCGYTYKAKRKNKVLYAPLIPVTVVVRKEGEAVQMPVVSRSCPLRIKAVKIEKTTMSTPPFDTRVSLTLESLDGTGNIDSRYRLFNPRLVDERGKEIRATKKFPWVAGSGVPIQGFYVMMADENIPVRGYEFPSKLIPANICKVILKAEASVNDCWPLPISIVVRDNQKPLVKVAAKQ